MKIATIGVGAILPLIKLADTVTEPEVIAALTKVITEHGEQAQAIVKLTDEKSGLETKVADLEKTVSDKGKEVLNAKVVALVDGAISARKIMAAEKENYIKLAEANFDITKAVLDSKPANPSIKESLSATDGSKSELVKLSEMSFDELHRNGKLVKLKELDVNAYNAKFKEEYGKDPK